MKRSLVASVSFHVAVLGAALFALPSPDAFKVEQQDAVQVDISQITDESKRKATTTEDSLKTEKPAPKKTEVVDKVKPAPKVAEEIKTAVQKPAIEEPPPEPEKEEPKKEEPKPEEPKKVEKPQPDVDALAMLAKKEEEKAQAEAVKKAEAEKKKADEKKAADEKKKVEEKKKAEDKKKADAKKLAEKKKAEERKKKFDDIAAFLNKEEGERTAPQEASEITGSPEKADANTKGADNALAATMIDALRQRLSECWSVPPGAREANIVVKVKFSLNQDGSVNGLPSVINDSGDPLFGTTAQSAVSAVMECQNYDFLPPDKYDLWNTITINFNPNMMFG